MSNKTVAVKSSLLQRPRLLSTQLLDANDGGQGGAGPEAQVEKGDQGDEAPLATTHSLWMEQWWSGGAVEQRWMVE